eukprot:jgi/Ulvmu1/8249/UM041_0060.1
MINAVLILVGSVGSGKSTFSESLLSNGSARWARISQDALKTRKACETAMRAALICEKCCVIDRCNYDADQRAPWIRIAKSRNVPCYGLWLNLPKELVCERAYQRTHHEGGVVGATASRLASQTHQQIAKDGGPSLFEGFQHVCQVAEDIQVQQVLRAWQHFTPCTCSAHEVLMHVRDTLPAGVFVTLGNGRLPLGTDSTGPTLGPLVKKRTRQTLLLQNTVPEDKPADDHVDNIKPSNVQAGTGVCPSQVPVFKSASGPVSHQVIPGHSGTEQQHYCIASHQKHDQACCSLPPSLIGEADLALTQQAHTKVCRRGLPQSLQAATSSSPAWPQPDSNPASQRLRTEQGPEALGARTGEYDKMNNTSGSQGPGTPKANAFSVMMAAATRSAASPMNFCTDSLTVSSGVALQSKFNWTKTGTWAAVFTAAIADPERYRQQNPSLYVGHCDDLLIIRDQYPKARVHLLVIARDAQLLDISCLRRQHVSLLQMMQARAEEWIVSSKYDKAEFQMGFHWKPSMKQLHMHCISADFISDALRQPKHWRSFTTDFFRKVDSVIAELERDGMIWIDFKAIDSLMKAPLACHRCGLVLASLPAVKQHIQACGKGVGVGVVRKS